MMGFVHRNVTQFIDLCDGSPVYVKGLLGCRCAGPCAFGDGGANALQITPGRFDERIFQALDFVIYEARRHHIRFIFLTSKPSRAIIRIMLSMMAIITRKNSYSGVRYSDQPAIFAWELINEPRCESNSSGPLLQQVVKERILEHL
ncbi:hypothetical protein OPV22_012970 [Ensete ventricosum]|uniref:mannan endo-1,4-beta-mannosidase n=1 Tax=Ensete ventricosum TaxID=4639 RepID=A0AAV8QZT3_ENSVE|nr:hypothetical protein OPV22_012970 [Ensete ventricosum]